MRRIVTSLLLASSLASAARAQANACVPAKTALVLAGGGAKGFAHIGVLQTLDSLGIKPDLIVGTSIGAIMGGLYASGYSAHEVDSVMRVLPIERVIRRYEPAVSASLGVVRPVAVWELGQSGYVLQSGAVREGEVNALVSAMMLRGNLIARGSFDSLPIPFRAVAADLASRAPVVLSSGDLGRAVRASAALPLVFRPVQDGDRWLTDGGLADNVPFSVARELGAQRVWVSTLPYGAPEASALEDPVQLWISLMSSLFHEDALIPAVGDVMIVSPTQKMANLDFTRRAGDSLIAMGRASSRAAFASAACINPLGHARQRPVPHVTTTFAVTGGDAVDKGAVTADLGLVSGGGVPLARLQNGLLTIGKSERYRSLWLGPTGSGDSVAFQPALQPAPQKAFGLGIAYDQFMSGRLWLGGVNRSLWSGNAEGSLLMRVGTYAQDLTGFVRRRAQVGTRSLPLAGELSVMHESVRSFYGKTELAGVENRQIQAFFGLREDPTPGAWRYEIGLESRFWRETAKEPRGAVGVRARLLRARSEYEMGSTVDITALNDYQRVALDLSSQWGDADTDVRLRLRAGWAHRMPANFLFPLAGPDGFAGFRIGELLGSQELFSSVLVRSSINEFLRWRVELMAGEVSQGYGVLRKYPGTVNGVILTGLRAGFEATTPLGPIRLEQGFSQSGERSTLIRVGYWF